ncbi:PAS domain [Pseudocohnilembus persalinus]|uniref:PAS domain n=1 Tax=Pseudocohnilembus persalinus TaxID=266149 RepID=A0A0V0QJG8_PSEPJ|nr:PAS domain [Pseudocohnilembus persalinus]|eukprot:KRX02149.1 PAS domain [Pseudocohnilembus persalinus]
MKIRLLLLNQIFNNRTRLINQKNKQAYVDLMGMLNIHQENCLEKECPCQVNEQIYQEKQKDVILNEADTKEKLQVQRQEQNLDSKTVSSITILQGNVGILVVSFRQEKGKILRYSQQIPNIYGYDQQEFQTITSIKQLMPKIIGDNHDLFINRLVQTGQPKIMRTYRRALSRNKEGFIIDMNLYVNYYFQISHEFSFSALGLHMISQSKLALLNDKGVIQGVNRNLGTLIDPAIKGDDYMEIYMQILIPSIGDLIQNYDLSQQDYQYIKLKLELPPQEFTAEYFQNFKEFIGVQSTKNQNDWNEINKNVQIFMEDIKPNYCYPGNTRCFELKANLLQDQIILYTGQEFNLYILEIETINPINNINTTTGNESSGFSSLNSKREIMVQQLTGQSQSQIRIQSSSRINNQGFQNQQQLQLPAGDPYLNLPKDSCDITDTKRFNQKENDINVLEVKNPLEQEKKNNNINDYNFDDIYKNELEEEMQDKFNDQDNDKNQKSTGDNSSGKNHNKEISNGQYPQDDQDEQNGDLNELQFAQVLENERRISEEQKEKQSLKTGVSFHEKQLIQNKQSKIQKKMDELSESYEDADFNEINEEINYKKNIQIENIFQNPSEDNKIQSNEGFVKQIIQVIKSKKLSSNNLRILRFLEEIMLMISAIILQFILFTFFFFLFQQTLYKDKMNKFEQIIDITPFIRQVIFPLNQNIIIYSDLIMKNDGYLEISDDVIDFYQYELENQYSSYKNDLYTFLQKEVVFQPQKSILSDSLENLKMKNQDNYFEIDIYLVEYTKLISEVFYQQLEENNLNNLTYDNDNFYILVQNLYQLFIKIETEIEIFKEAYQKQIDNLSLNNIIGLSLSLCFIIISDFAMIIGEQRIVLINQLYKHNGIQVFSDETMEQLKKLQEEEKQNVQDFFNSDYTTIGSYDSNSDSFNSYFKDFNSQNLCSLDIQVSQKHKSLCESTSQSVFSRGFQTAFTNIYSSIDNADFTQYDENDITSYLESDSGIQDSVSYLFLSEFIIDINNQFQNQMINMFDNYMNTMQQLVIILNA